MKRFHAFATLLIAAVALLTSGVRSDAALVVTNGSFESPNITAGAQVQDVPSWFDSTGNFTSWHRGESTDPQENGTQMLAMGPGSGASWVYQSLGTMDFAGGTLNWTLDKARFADGNASVGLTVRFYSGNPSGTPADGTLITSLGGLTQIGSDVTLLPLGSNSSGTGVVTETGSVSLTGLTAGTQVWISLTGSIDNTTNYISGPTGGYAPFDNISVVHVPTPAALSAGVGLLVLAAMRRRRRLA